MSRTAAEFIQDISSGEEIYMEVFRAACSWDFETKMQDIVDNSGYDLPPDNLKAAYEAPPKWSLAMFGGEYIFSEPDNLKDKSLFVNPTTEQVIMLGDIQEPELKAGKDPKYEWTITPEDEEGSTSETYTITFDVGFKINELPSYHTCQGTRESDSKTVKAAQKIPDKDDKDGSSKVPDPKDTGDGVNDVNVIGSWIGVGGLALVGLVFAYVMYKQRQKEAAEAQSNADAAFGTNTEDESKLKEIARKSKDALLEAYSELKTKTDAILKGQQTIQYIEMQDMRHPTLNVEYASLQRPVDEAIATYLNEYLSDHRDISPEDLTTKKYENILNEMREEATLRARRTFRDDSRDRATEESDRKYGGLAELSAFVYHDPVAQIATTVAERDFDRRDASLRSYAPIVLDAWIQKEIATLAYERGDAYTTAANVADQAAEKAKSDKVEKEKAKEEIENQLEDQTISEEKRKELEDERDKLQGEIDALDAEQKKQEEQRDRDNEDAKKETDTAADADEKAGEKRQESNKDREKIFTKK